MIDNQQRLILGLKNGDRAIFEEVYRLYYTPLCFYCARYVGDIDEAEEIVQNLFFKVWLNRDSMDISNSLKSYLYRSVQNHSLNYLNQNILKKKYILDKKHLLTANYDTGQQRLEDEELQKLLKRALLQLPEKRRKIFELSRFNGLKYNQIAEQLTISVKTVETQMTKALKHLREVFKEYIPLIAVLWSLWP